MGKPRTKKPANRALRSDAQEDDLALVEALHHVDQLIETLELRTKLACERASEAVKGTRAAARAMQRVEEIWADLEAGRRLRDEIIAAVSIATAEVALVETTAATAIRSAFQQFVAARRWRRTALAVKKPTSARSRKRENVRSLDDLGEMAAKAKEATAYAIADRNRLSLGLAKVRIQVAELRRHASAAPEDGDQRKRAMREVELCEARAAYLYQQLLAQTAAVDHLKVNLWKLFERLSECSRTPAPPAEQHHLPKPGPT